MPERGDTPPVWRFVEQQQLPDGRVRLWFLINGKDRRSVSVWQTHVDEALINRLGPEVASLRIGLPPRVAPPSYGRR